MSERTPADNTRAVFLDAATTDRDDVNLTALQAVGCEFYPSTHATELLTHTDNAWCVIVNKVVLDRAFFRQRPDLRLVCIIATGTNNVDLQAAQEQGVAVVNCRGYSTNSVAQHALLLMLTLLRSAASYQTLMAGNAWAHSSQFCLLDYPIAETSGLQLGLIGYGDIGKKTAELARAFGMRVVVSERRATAPREGRMAFSEVIATSDIISLHCPLTPQTENIIDQAELEKMQPSALLLNTARGGLVNETALLSALTNQQIAGAALDVLASEPPAADDPLLNAELANLIITPHIGWASREARQEAIQQTADNINSWLKGENLRRVV